MQSRKPTKLKQKHFAHSKAYETEKEENEKWQQQGITETRDEKAQRFFRFLNNCCVNQKKNEKEDQFKL